MSYGGYDPNRIPVFLEASSKEKLMELMLVMQDINSTNFNYQTPMLENKKWVVWFFADLNKHKIIKEQDLKKISSVVGMIDGVDDRGVE